MTSDTVLFTYVVAGLFSLLAAMSPGPDFALVTHASLFGGVKSGIKTSFGIATALTCHLFAVSLGITLLFETYPALSKIIQYAGAFYLLYLGTNMILPLIRKADESTPTPQKKGQTGFFAGFLCNLLNPKVPFFLLALFTQFSNAHSSFVHELLLSCTFLGANLFWFCSLTLLLSLGKIADLLTKNKRSVQGIMGCSLILLAVYFTM